MSVEQGNTEIDTRKIMYQGDDFIETLQYSLSSQHL
jgi:hypothetical protein